MTPDQIWQATLGELRLQLTKSTFDVWLASTALLAHDPDTNAFTIGAPDECARDWLQDRMASTIRRTLTGVSGRAVSVAFVVNCDHVAKIDATVGDIDNAWAPDGSEFGVPPIFHNESLETLDWSRATLQKPQLREYVEHALDYFEAGIGLTLIGPPGVGKTHIAVGLLKMATLAGWSAHFTGMVSLLDQLRATFGAAKEGALSLSERRILRGLANTRLLVLDDLRVDSLTVWARDRVYAILNPRWEASRPTIVTSNYTPDELVQAMGRERPGMDEGTLSRLVRSALTIRLEGVDYRIERKRKALAAVQAQHSTHASTSE